MGAGAVAVFVAMHHEIMLFALVGFLVGGLDDLAMDLVYVVRRAWRRIIIYSRHPRMTTPRLPPAERAGLLAIFVPAWREADVIGPMLRTSLRRWSGDQYRIFVGAYPNDIATIDAIADVAAGEPRLILAINDRDGPTSKGDCLNRLWRAMQAEEARIGEPFKAVILHDAEDLVHADELRLFDLLIDRFALVQLPVLPLEGRGDWRSRAIANHYGDEFAESHGRLMAVREAIGAAIPSAGVACAFQRTMLARLVDPVHRGPFDPVSLTEDYEAGLRIAALGGRAAFVRMRDAEGQLVASRGYFPDSWDAAVRQKARWTLGIALAGWDRLGWQGGPTEWWMRFRDRRAPLAALVLLAGYGALLLWPLRILAEMLYPGAVPPLSPLLALLLGISGGLMVWRTAVRTLFSIHCYGWRHGIGAIPRLFVANCVAISAARRAVGLYLRSLKGSAPIWDKTQHRFPDLPPDAVASAGAARPASSSC